MSAPLPDDLPVMRVASRADWCAWLRANHAESAGVWLLIAKKGAAFTSSVTYPEALEEALCYGWIDGQRRAHDDECFLQRFTPRTRRSIWSKVNRARVEALIASGAMQPAGHAAIDSARRDGRWEAAYEPQRTAEVPADLAAALAASPRAKAFFATLGSQNRYAILFRIQGAKRPETRARRVARFVEMLERGEKIYP